MFKNMRLVILLDMLLNPSFKMTADFANIARTTASTNKFKYQENFKSQGFGFFYEKESLILNELKTSLMLNFS